MYLSKCNMLYMFCLVTRVYIQFPGKKDWFLHWWWNRCCWKGITAFCIFAGLWKISSVMIPILLDRASAIPTSELSLRKCLINTSFQTYCVKVLSVFRSSMLASLSTCMWSIHIVFDCWRDVTADGIQSQNQCLFSRARFLGVYVVVVLLSVS